MQGPSWVALFGRIPPLLQDSLMIVTINGSEIVPQAIVRLECDYVVLRGRMAGSQDTGRLMFVPYDQINYVGLTKKLSDAETQALLGKPGTTVQFIENGEPVPDTPVAEAPEAPAAAEAAAPPVEQAAPPPATAKPAHPSKSVLLARLRARLAGEAGKPPGA
ncbi:MAG TPA: hypothetical protein VEL76_17535 [Gemmataceae bacterium]|nr:hypothetical protein [Gemmataceae bacterium]